MTAEIPTRITCLRTPDETPNNLGSTLPNMATFTADTSGGATVLTQPTLCQSSSLVVDLRPVYILVGVSVRSTPVRSTAPSHLSFNQSKRIPDLAVSTTDPNGARPALKPIILIIIASSFAKLGVLSAITHCSWALRLTPLRPLMPEGVSSHLAEALSSLVSSADDMFTRAGTLSFLTESSKIKLGYIQHHYCTLSFVLNPLHPNVFPGASYR